MAGRERRRMKENGRDRGRQEETKRREEGKKGGK